ncbi:MAG: RNA polymerase sigma factor [Kordiimonadaceae bacterium]|nr:RNA polymerase sigma factor [Kordiimonadaceae bacterium]
MPHRHIDDWFTEEVLALEPVLVGFLRRHWRDEADILDLRQETYARVYEAAHKQRPVYAKAFVFRTARNLIIDRARRAQVVSMETIADFESVPVIEDELDAEARLSSRQELKALQRALDLLPPRCREIVIMRKIEGHSQRHVATALGLAQSTVEKQVSKGVRKLADALYGEGGTYANDATPRARAQQERKK